MMDYAVPLQIRCWLHQMLDRLPLNLRLDLWGQTILNFNHGTSDPITLHIHHPGILRRLFLSQDPLMLVDGYLQGFIDVDGDLTTVLPLVQRYPHAKIPLLRSLQAWLEAWALPNLPTAKSTPSPWKRFQFHTRDRDRAAIQHHYDAGNAFYHLWLDPELVYSCAYFEHPQLDLQAAQTAKLDRICRKLKLAPGESLLDIGCGWGALMRWAATHYGVQAHGITLSQEQLAYNQQRIAAAGLSHQITVELLDYRDLPAEPKFDKIVSVGMVEHVGADQYPVYFQTVLAALKPDGLFLNHGIATRDRWNRSSLGERFIDRYIFPDGQLTLLSTQLAAAEEAGWEVVDVDNWRSHYAKTLRCWVDNFETAFDAIVAQIGERSAHIWRLYLSGCALGFENNYMGIYQTVLRRQVDLAWKLPITRHDWLC